MSAIKQLLITSNIDPAKAASGDVGVLLPLPLAQAGVFRRYSVTAAQLWKLGNVIYDSEHQDFSYIGSFGSNSHVLSDWLDESTGYYIKQFDWDFSINGSGYAGFYFGAAASSSSGTTGLNFDFYSERAGDVDFTAKDNASVSHTVTKTVVAGWQSMSIPWTGAGGFDPSSFPHPATSFNVEPASTMPVGVFRIDTIRYDSIVTMAGSSPTVLNGVQFAFAKVDPGTSEYNVHLGQFKINQTVIDGPDADPDRYRGIPRWTYKWMGSGENIGYGAWRGPSAVGYNWLAGWAESGIVNPDNGSVMSAAILQMMYDSQQAYVTQFPAKQIGPFVPRYGRASWEALNTGGYVAGVWTDNTYNKWYWPSTDDWYGYTMRALLSVAGHYYLTRSAQAKTILDNWMAWLDVYIIADGAYWQPPSGYGNDGNPTYTYKPPYAYFCIAAACIYKYWVDGDALALKWYRRMLDTCYATKLLTATGQMQGVLRGNEGSGYTTAAVNFTVNGGATPPTATAILAGGKVVRIQKDTAGANITSISATITGDGTGATCTPYLSDLLVGSFDDEPAGWDVAEWFNTIAMLVNGSRPGGTVSYPTTCLSSDTSAYNGLVALYQRNTTGARPSLLNADKIPLHEFDVGAWHNNKGIENPMVRDTHVRGALWTETLGPTMYAAVEYGRQCGDWSWLEAQYALTLELIGLPGGSKHLVNTPRPSNGLADAYTDMIGGEPLQANKRGNLDGATYVVNASKQIVIPSSAGGGNVTWVRGAWQTGVTFRYDGFMAEIDPDYVGDTTNYASVSATNQYSGGVYSTVIQLAASASIGATLQVYYSYRDGSVSAKGEAMSGWPMLHRDPYQGTANDGDNYLMMALYHAWRSTGNAKYKTAADRIGNALLHAGRWEGNETTFALPFEEEAGQTGIYSYHEDNTPFEIGIGRRPGTKDRNALQVRATVLTGQTPVNFAGFGFWPSWPITPSTPFTSIDFELRWYGNARKLAQAAHERYNAMIGRSYLDWCNNTFGVAPCTATGEPCYQTYGTCKDKPNYSRGSKMRQYCLRGMAIVPGETMRPYITGSTFSPTEIPVGGGLAQRSHITVTMADEVCADYEDDPYIASRAAPAQGTYWTRNLARNYNSAGRKFELLNGYITDPFDWEVFQTELYVIESIKGPDNGNVTFTLSDVIKPLDKSMLPTPTSGALTADFKAIEHTHYAAGGGAASIVLHQDASPVDGAYVGMECYIAQNTGAGQRRTITAYVGETRTATVSAWAVVPDTTSVYEVSALSINVGSGNGAQYANPVNEIFNSGIFNGAIFNTGSATPDIQYQYICIGDEVIRYTAKDGDVLSWPSSEYRAQFGTPREDHGKDDGVQQCYAPVDKSVTDVIQEICNAAGVADTYIDLAGLAQEDADWLGAVARITACIPAPEKASSLLNDLLRDLNMYAWPDPVAQKIKFKADMPQLAGAVKEITPVETIGKSMQVVPLDDLRITQAYISYAPFSATGSNSSRQDFKHTNGYRDAGAESANEYNGVVQKQIFSKWLSSANELHARALVARKRRRFRNAPFRAKFKLDPRDEVGMADLIDVTSNNKTSATGAPLKVRMRVTKLQGAGNQDVEAVSTTFEGRNAFIAPFGCPDYADATEEQRAMYAYICDANEKMPDGTGGYLIL